MFKHATSSDHTYDRMVCDVDVELSGEDAFFEAAMLPNVENDPDVVSL